MNPNRISISIFLQPLSKQLGIANWVLQTLFSSPCYIIFRILYIMLVTIHQLICSKYCSTNPKNNPKHWKLLWCTFSVENITYVCSYYFSVFYTTFWKFLNANQCKSDLNANQSQCKSDANQSQGQIRVEDIMMESRTEGDNLIG